MTQDEMKKAVAKAAIEYVETGTIIGIGTGSTANFFIEVSAPAPPPIFLLMSWRKSRARSKAPSPVRSPVPTA